MNSKIYVENEVLILEKENGEKVEIKFCTVEDDTLKLENK